jgi:threonine/homoserine/homoserine lactone efflux protein
VGEAVALGVVFGVGAAISVGPIFVTIVHESITRGFGAGLQVIFGSAVGDVLLLVPALAASWLITRVDAASPFVALAGGAYFVFLSAMAARASWRFWRRGGVSPTTEKGWSFAKGLFGNLLNPLSWGFWLATGTPTMLYVYRLADWSGVAAFTGVWFGVAMAVEGLVAAVVAQTRKLVGRRTLAVLQAAAALTFLVTAAVLLHSQDWRWLPSG